MKRKEFLTVKVFWLPATKEIFFSGEAQSVSSRNQLGNFDILPRHANFITLIFNDLTIIKPSGEKINYKFNRGVLEVSQNKVNVFLGL